MSSRALARPLARPLALALACVMAAAPAFAVNLGAAQSLAYSPGGLTYAEARGYMPGLDQVTFEKADANGDGVIEGSEWPVLQSLYNALYRSR